MSLKYHSRDEMMKHRLSIRIKGTPEMVDLAASIINDAVASLGQVVESPQPPFEKGGG